MYYMVYDVLPECWSNHLQRTPEILAVFVTMVCWECDDLSSLIGVPVQGLVDGKAAADVENPAHGGEDEAAGNCQGVWVRVKTMFKKEMIHSQTARNLTV